MKIAFLFSGQGAQYPGMMKELYESEDAVKAVFDCADSTLGRSVSALSFEGTQEDLNLTHNTQPCVLTADLAAAAALKAHGIVPEGTAGFSLGEYAALAFAGSLTEEEAFHVIQIRADAMQEAVAPGEGAMAAMIGKDAQTIEELCKEVTEGYVIPANYNSPEQTVISGDVKGVDAALALAEEKGIRSVRLAVSAPFHCALMEPAAKRLEQEFENTAFSAPQIPVYMNVDGEVHEKEEIPGLLVRQAMSPVHWVKTLENMQKDGFDTFIECGPGRTLSGLVKKTLKGVTILRVENRKTLDAALEALGKE